MERLYDYENGTENRKETQQDGHEVPPGVTDGEVMDRRGSSRGCRRRSRRRKRKCICKSRKRRRGSRRQKKLRLSANPFLIFYLEMYFKSPGKHVTAVAREAGKKWCSMPEKAKEKYIRLAERVKRRCSRKRR